MSSPAAMELVAPKLPPLDSTPRARYFTAHHQMPQLIVIHPERGEVAHELASDEITVGAHPDNAIRIEDPSVSARHARLIRANGAYRLEDLGSTNRCRVEGREVAAAELAGSCRLAFGNVSARYEAATASASAPPELAAFEQSVAAIFKARDALQQQNASLAAERDAARAEAARITTELAAVKDHLARAAGQDRQRIGALENETRELRAQAERAVADLEIAAANHERTREELDALRTAAARFTAACRDLAAPLAPEPKPSERTIAKPPTGDIPNALSGIHRSFHAFAQNPEDMELLGEVLLRAYSLSQQTAASHSSTVFNLASALEALVRDLHTVPTEITPGTIRSVGEAIDLLGILLHPGALERSPAPLVHCLAQEGAERATIAAALESVNLRPTFLDHSELSVASLLDTRTNVILLTRADHTAISAALRKSTTHKQTPLLLIGPALSEDDRIAATLGGIDDTIPHPFNPHDLAVKALTWALRSQLPRT